MVLADMRFNTQFKRSTLMLSVALAATSSLIPSEAHATTFILGADIFRDYTYGSTTVSAAPYNGQLVGTGVSDALLFFGIDQRLAVGFGQSYTGHVRGTESAAEEEAAWLASYALSQGAP